MAATTILSRAARALRIAAGSGRMWAIAALAGVVWLKMIDPTPLVMTRHAVFDLLQRSAPRVYETRHTVIIDVDEASIAELGQWPWPRTAIARMVEVLNAAGARAVGFDIVFSEPDRLSPPAVAMSLPGLPPLAQGLLSQMPSSDTALAEALARGPNVLGASARESQFGAMETAPPEPAAEIVGLGGDPRRHVFAFPSILPNLAELSAMARGEGLFTLTPEHDGVVRRVPAVLRVGDHLYPSLSLEMLRVASGAARYGAIVNAAGVGLIGVRLRGLDIPTDAQGRIWLHAAPHAPELYVSAADVVAGRVDPERLAGRFALVGASAVGLRDLRQTPLEQAMPGVEVHAQIIDTVLSGDFLTRPHDAEIYEHLAAIFGAALLILIAPRLSAAGALPLYFALLTAVGATAFVAFTQFGLALDATYPAIAFTLVFAALAYANYSKVEAQRAQIRQAFSQYLSPDLVKQLAERPEELSLGGETREMTFLFCDLAGFTAFVEKTEPATLVRLLNAYLDGVCGVIMEHGGTIDKIVGDAVHSMFNAPLDEPRHAEKAVRAALAVEAFVIDFRKRMAAEGHAFGGTRIGVNTGPAIVGNFGGERRFDYTAHGDAINTAARLEGANKHLGTTICVSASTVARCEGLSFRPIGALVLAGKDVAVETFEPIRGETARHAAAYGDAFKDMLGGAVDRAAAAFAELAPEDPLARLHARRLASGASGDRIVLEGK